MDLIEVAGHLSTSVRTRKHKSAVGMEQTVREIAEANEGKLVSLEISKPGTALLFVVGDIARQAVMREFRRLADVVVTEVPALAVQRERNIALQKKSDASKERFAKRKGM